MPEIAEVARAVHFVRKCLVGKTFEKVTAIDDNCVFGKVGTSHTEIMKHLTGKKVIDAGQQGKYFWMIMSSPPHPVIHFGMAGWLKFKSEHSFYYTKKHDKEEAWPPKFWKAMFVTDGEGEDKVEAAYCDSRRFGRIRLVDCPGKDIRKHSPLVENGPDPVQDKDVVTFEWLKELCNRKKVPIKAMLLDQANISGIGNWVGDEIMFNAKMHPEQYANTLSDSEITQLHKSIHYICGTAVDLLADMEQFPKTWLFKHRWGKGKSGAKQTLPTGEKIVFLTVGGRTSAVVPSIQKKTGLVAKEMSEAEEDVKVVKGNKSKKSQRVKSEDEESDILEEPPKKSKLAKRTRAEAVDETEEPPKKPRSAKRAKIEVVDEPEEQPPTKKGRVSAKPKEEVGSRSNAADSTSRSKKSSPRAKTDPNTNKPDKKAKPAVKKAANSKSVVDDEEENLNNGRRRSSRHKA